MATSCFVLIATQAAPRPAAREGHVSAKMEPGLIKRYLPRVLQRMAGRAESDQVVFGVVPTSASMLFVMHL